MKKFSILIVLVVFIIIGGIFGLRAIMIGTSSVILNNTASFLFGIKNIVQFRGIISESNTLKSEMLDLRAQFIETEDIRRENELLRTQLNIGSRKNYNLETVKFFNVSYEEITSTAFINKGQKDGIEMGMPVIIGKSTLIGLVLEVFDKYSKVMLVTDKRFKMTVLDEGLDHFLAMGSGRGEVLLDFVAPRDNFREKELIVSEVSEKVPAFLVIGEIESISYAEADLFKKVKIKPAFLDLDIRNGFVIKDF